MEDTPTLFGSPDEVGDSEPEEPGVGTEPDVKEASDMEYDGLFSKHIEEDSTVQPAYMVAACGECRKWWLDDMALTRKCPDCESELETGIDVAQMRKLFIDS